MRDVLGYTLEEAGALLAEEGFVVERAVETFPSRRVQLVGALRVVRQREVGERRVELVVTRERYEEKGGKGEAPADG